MQPPSPSVRWQGAEWLTSCPSQLDPGIIHFISNTDQLGQFMNRPLVGLGGKYLYSRSLLIKSANSLSLSLSLSSSLNHF